MRTSQVTGGGTDGQRMTSPSGRTDRNVIVRSAMLGMVLAVVGLGGTAFWSTSVMQNQASDLAQAGSQTRGQLEALQALGTIRIQTNALEDGVTPERTAELTAARQQLPAGLAEMTVGSNAKATEVAQRAIPIARKLDPAIDRYLNDPLGDVRYHGEDDGDDASEDAMDAMGTELEQLLNSSDSDPSDVISSLLGQITGSERAVRQTTYVLVPLGLLALAVCGWLLVTLRRRSDLALRTTIETTTEEARTDHLTGLPNRRALVEELDERVAAGRPFVVAMADLNGFKRYNDTYGHPAGDALLRRLGRRLSTAIDGQGFAARLGGDEFCVLLRVPPLGNVEATSAELIALVREALTEEGTDYRIDASCGTSAYPVEATDGGAALRLADQQLYAAKAVRR